MPTPSTVSQLNCLCQLFSWQLLVISCDVRHTFGINYHIFYIIFAIFSTHFCMFLYSFLDKMICFYDKTYVLLYYLYIWIYAKGFPRNLYMFTQLWAAAIYTCDPHHTIIYHIVIIGACAEFRGMLIYTLLYIYI